jgi:hypothetical protein
MMPTFIIQMKVTRILELLVQAPTLEKAKAGEFLVFALRNSYDCNEPEIISAVASELPARAPKS